MRAHDRRSRSRIEHDAAECPGPHHHEVERPRCRVPCVGGRVPVCNGVDADMAGPDRHVKPAAVVGLHAREGRRVHLSARDGTTTDIGDRAGDLDAAGE